MPIHKAGLNSFPSQVKKRPPHPGASIKPVQKPVELKRSELEVYDIPLELLVDSPENPNEQNEAIFDQLTQGVKEEGIDEPIIVVPGTGKFEGKFVIVSGHHRVKAARVNGDKVIPCIIKKNWDDDKRLVELVRRNNLRGNINAEKFVMLYNKAAKNGMDKSILKLKMGFTNDQLFDKMFKQVEKNLTPAQKKKLVEAKERITSTESFSTVLNEIFTEHGSELDTGMICFKYGDKKKQNIYYIKMDAELDKRMKSIMDEIHKRSLFAADVFNATLKNVDMSKFTKSDKVTVLRELRKPK